MSTLRHGEGRTYSPTVEYRVWRSMVSRCHNENHANYPSYGGRGIAVCDRWREDYMAFLSDVGRRPSKEHSLDRIDNAKGYEPGNVRWATKEEQQNNTRATKHVEYNGQVKGVSQWAREYGLRPNTLHGRLRLGWSAHEALTTPVTAGR